jgi:protein SCO1/2
MKFPAQLWRVIASLVILLAATACGGSHTFAGTAYNPIIPAPAIDGLIRDDEPFSLADLEDKVAIVFFGYTFCPDVCPLALADMAAVYNGLTPEEQADVAVVFVTTDPERDTPQRLAQYVTAFHPAFLGVHVPAADQESVKKGYGVYAEKRLVEGQSAAEYLIDHTGYTYVIDRKGQLREILNRDIRPEAIVPDIQYLLGQ